MGAPFRHEKMGNEGNVTCPIAPERPTGLRPSLTTPQFNKTSINSRTNYFTDLSKCIQFRAQKCINGKLENQRIVYLLVWSEQ